MNKVQRRDIFPVYHYLKILISLSTLTFIITGCAFQRYQAKPLSPQQTSSFYQSRNLDDAQLRQYLNKYLDTIPPDTIWDAKALSFAAFFYHPDLDIARSQLDVQKGKLITAGQRPNPRAGLNIGYNYTPGQIPISPWLFTPSLDFIIETAGKRKLRINQANYLIEAARLNVGVAAWQVRSRLRQQLASYLLFENDLELLRMEVALRSEYADGLQTLFDYGEITITDMELARITLNDARLRMVAAEGLAAERKVLLANSLGVPASALAGKKFVYRDVFHPPALNRLDTLEKQVLINNLNIHRALMDYAVSEATLQLEVAKQYPDVQVGTSLRFYQGQQRAQATPGVDLPIFNKNQGPIAEAKANRDVMAATFLQLQANALTELDRVQAVYQSNLKEYETAQTILKMNEEREKNINAVFNAGDLTYLDVLSARLETALARRALLQALVRLHTTLGSLENIVQKPLENSFEALPDLEANPREPQTQKN